jgi:uncharacterized membrane protein
MTEAAVSSRARIDSVDVLRGIYIAVSPTNLASTTAPLFFTRWITHICAQVFFLLTGTGAYLSLRRMTRAELSRRWFAEVKRRKAAWWLSYL